MKHLIMTRIDFTPEGPDKDGSYWATAPVLHYFIEEDGERTDYTQRLTREQWTALDALRDSIEIHDLAEKLRKP